MYSTARAKNGAGHTMAKVLGESGRYVANESAKNARRQFLVAFVCVWIASMVGGFMSGYFLRAKTAPLTSVLVLVAASIFVWLVYRVGARRMDEFEKARISFRKGATGEAAVARILSDFPEDYHVINDLSTPFGNLDHVVIGPTGVYVIETKNWKGVITSDGKGDLLLNGKPPNKPCVRPLVARVMDVREKVAALYSARGPVNEPLPFFNAVLVFPSAKVEAQWRTTGSADCVSDERLWDYIVGNKKGTPLSRSQIEGLARAFLALATMDREFKARPTAVTEK